VEDGRISRIKPYIKLQGDKLIISKGVSPIPTIGVELQPEIGNKGFIGWFAQSTETSKQVTRRYAH
jgi:hypothetical protein